MILVIALTLFPTLLNLLKNNIMSKTINYLVSITTTKIPNAKPHLVRCPAEQIQTLMFEFPNSIFLIQELPDFVSHPELSENEGSKR